METHVKNLFCSESFIEEEMITTEMTKVQAHRLYVKASIDDSIIRDDRVITNVVKDERPAVTTDYFSLQQTCIKPHMRKIVVDWMCEVCDDLSYDSEVFCLAVNYLDRFLCEVTISKNQFQLTAAVCLLLASKFSQVIPFSLEQLVTYTDNSITPEEMISWELLILDTLQWEMVSVTSLSVIRLISPHIPAMMESTIKTCESLAVNSTGDYQLASLPPSIVAAGCILSVFRYSTLENETLTILSSLLKKHSEHICQVSQYIENISYEEEIAHVENSKIRTTTSRPMTPTNTLEVM